MFKKILNLRKFIVIAICITGSCVSMFAQDIITLKNGDDIKAIVQEVGINEVKYKKFDNSNGPLYTLKKTEIFMIRYENGSKDVFSELSDNNSTGKQTEKTEKSEQPELSYRNGIWQNGTKLSIAQAKNVLSINSDALEKYQSGRSLYIVGQVIAYPCAFLFGWDLGTRLGGGEGSGALLGIGVSGTVLGLVLSYSGEGMMKNSVRIYNAKISPTLSYQVNFGFTQEGIGFRFSF